MKEEDGMRILFCFIAGFILVFAGIGTLPLGFLLTVSGIFLIIYGFSPEEASNIVEELGDIAKELIGKL
jgi:hypothetical protein